MSIIKKLKKEGQIIRFVIQGYTRYNASRWVRHNLLKEDDKHSKNYRKLAYKNGFFADSAQHYGLKNKAQIRASKFIKDIDCVEMLPFNTSFNKWVGSHIMTRNILNDYKDIIPEVLVSIVKRDYEMLITYKADSNRVITKDEFVTLIKEQGPFLLRPLFYQNYEMKETFFVDDTFDFNLLSENRFNEYVLIKPFKEDGISTAQVDVYVASDINELLQFSYREYDEESGVYIEKDVDIKTGSTMDGCVVLEQDICKTIEEYAYAFSERLPILTFFKIRFDVDSNHVMLDSIITKPTLPKYAFSDKLNDYLIEKSKNKKDRINKYKKSYFNALRKVMGKKLIMAFSRKGTRFFMQKLWLQSIKDDFHNNGDVRFNKKLWAWRRGFLSFRIHQYELTNDNYKDFLSDYDYMWLNRINGNYQIYLNDKATFRYFLSDYKELLPKYYFLLYKGVGGTVVYGMPDYLESNNQLDINHIISLLKKEKMLALKRSSGLHGKGFYRLEYKEENFFINGAMIDEKDLIHKIMNLQHNYIVTEYLVMIPELRRIYPDSANTLRMVVVNDTTNNPVIKQCYMRIGSSKSNYTDNIAFGGIVVDVDLEDGSYEEGEILVNHFYVKCKTHPDTKVEIKGYIPNWDGVCSKILEVAKAIPEMEYMGFDVVISDTGLKILEINIYPDLHKVSNFSDDMSDYFKKKIEIKKHNYL